MGQTVICFPTGDYKNVSCVCSGQGNEAGVSAVSPALCYRYRAPGGPGQGQINGFMYSDLHKEIMYAEDMTPMPL